MKLSGHIYVAIFRLNFGIIPTVRYFFLSLIQCCVSNAMLIMLRWLMLGCGVHNQYQLGKNVYAAKVLNVDYIVAIMLKKSRPI